MAGIRIMLYILLAAVCATGTAAATEPLTPALYVQIEHEARQVTISGMQQRLQLLAQGGDTEVLQQADLANQQQVTEVFAAYGTTAAKHAAYGAAQADEIAAFIADNPEWAEDARRLDNEFDALVAQFAEGGNGE